MPTVDELLEQQQLLQEQHEAEMEALKSTLTQMNESLAGLEQKQSQEYGNRLREEVDRLTNNFVYGTTAEQTEALRATHRDAVIAQLTVAAAQNEPINVSALHNKVLTTATSNMNGFSPSGHQATTHFRDEAPVSPFVAAVDKVMNSNQYQTMEDYLKQDKM